MCGIAGYAGTRSLGEQTLADCLGLMRRRGPDHAAWRAWRTPAGRQVYLLHSRLGIIDLDARANQPFRSGRRWIAYNGELYNYLEVRAGLAARGHRFTTSSDTEVLLRAIGEAGVAALDRCEGMWAFAVYDEADGSLLLSRDRFGEKPLWLYRDGTGLYFGSEPKLVAALVGRPLPVNVEHLYRYLVNGYKALYKSGATFFVGLEELPAASVLRIDPEGGEDRRTYWEPACAPDETMSYDEAVRGVRDRLVRAVELRLRADVPLAFCMSGGVDSNALIGVARTVCGHDVHGFTIVNSDERYEEQDLVDHAVEKLGIRHTSIPVHTTDFLSRLRTLVRAHDAPVYTVTYFAHWLLMESVAAHGYRISVSGTAADELFSGYYDHHLAYLHDVRHDPGLHAAARRAWQREVQPFVRNPHLQDPDVFVRDPAMRDHVFFRADGFARYLTRPWAEPFTERPFAAGLLRNRMLNEVRHETVPVILHEDDLNAMYYSIENRSPYLDRDLFEFAYRIPTRHLVRDGLAKAVLRDAMRGIVPGRVLDNPRKVGFNAPVLGFLDTRDPAARRELLEDSPIFDHVQRPLRTDLPNSESKFLFSFVTSKLFLEEFGR
jgi:asparagine synthase (glutamine-hydrolysing)